MHKYTDFFGTTGIFLTNDSNALYIIEYYCIMTYRNNSSPDVDFSAFNILVKKSSASSILKWSMLTNETLFL